MKLLWVLRRAFKRAIIWARLGSWLTEYCKVCGRRQQLLWHAPDDLWFELNGGEGGVLCPRCFDQRAQEAGHWLLWTCKSPDQE